MNCSQSEFIVIGRFCKPFGVEGDIRVTSYSDQCVNFSRIRDIRVGETREVHKVVRWLLTKPLRCKIEGICTPEDARALMGKSIYVPREFAVSLTEGEYYVADLEHLNVVYNDEVVGEIKSIVKHTHTPLLEIELHDKKTVYIPFIKKFFASPDFQRMSIELLQSELLDTT